MKTRLILSAAILLAAGVALAGYDATGAVRVHGSVIVKTKQYETMVIVRSGDDNGGADHVFHMWAKPALAVDGSYAGAEVEFSGSSLILIVPAKRSVITFTVAGYHPNAVPIPEAFSTTGYTVMGLNHEVGTAAAIHTVHGGPSPYEACNDSSCNEAGWEAPDPWNSVSGGSSCYSGGLGASSCSQSNQYGSCSVICGMSSTYACCTNGNPPSCTCKVYM
jgi:hypothetical protein